MTVEEIHKELVSCCNSRIYSLREYIGAEEIKGYLRPWGELFDDGIAFMLGLRKFFLEFNIIYHTGQVYVKSYEIKRDKNSYGNWKQEHIPALDIAISAGCQAQFVVSAMVLSDFSKDYITQLQTWIEENSESIPG